MQEQEQGQAGVQDQRKGGASKEKQGRKRLKYWTGRRLLEKKRRMTWGGH